MSVARRAAILVLLAAATAPRGARADVWADAIGADRGRPDDEVEHTLRLGDDAALQANSEAMTRADRERLVEASLKLYRAAAAMAPRASEPYARMARVLESFYFERCGDPRVARSYGTTISWLCEPFSPARAQQLIDVWTELEARAPLDPRVANCFEPGRERCMLFERAILETKLATPRSLAAAARDYQWIIDHAHAGTDLGTVANNLAETHMMLGDLPDAITTYRLALTYSPDGSSAFGLAVALDRDDQGYEARQIIEDLGPDGFKRFAASVQAGETFFVPKGEVHYYFALVKEVLGDPEIAALEWRAFIDSGAHPQFQGRARAHLAAMAAAKTRPAARSVREESE